MKRGLFIVVEGIDGSGKTSFVKNFADFLKKSKTPFLSNFEPTKSSVFGVAVRRILHHKQLSQKLLLALEREIKKFKKKIPFFGEALTKILFKIKNNKNLSEIERQFLFIADRYFDLQDNIKPALKAGKIVLQDRFDISSAAYAWGAKKIPPALIFDLQKKVFGNIYCSPNIKVFLDIEPKEALKRIKRDRKSISFYEDLEKLKKVSRAYHKVLNLKGNEGKTIFYKVNPRKTKKENFQEIFKLIFPSNKSL